MGATPLYLAIILVRAMAYLRASAMLRVTSTVCANLTIIFFMIMGLL